MVHSSSVIFRVTKCSRLLVPRSLFCHPARNAPATTFQCDYHRDGAPSGDSSHQKWEASSCPPGMEGRLRGGYGVILLLGKQYLDVVAQPLLQALAASGGTGTPSPMRRPRPVSCVRLAVRLLRVRAIQRTCCISGGRLHANCAGRWATHDSDSLALPLSVQVECTAVVWLCRRLQYIPSRLRALLCKGRDWHVQSYVIFLSFLVTAFPHGAPSVYGPSTQGLAVGALPSVG